MVVAVEFNKRVRDTVTDKNDVETRILLDTYEFHRCGQEDAMKETRCLRDLSHPLKATTDSTQQRAKHVIATARFRNIIESSWPAFMAPIVISSSLKMNMRPPHARKKLASASVGGREGRTERGGETQTKKYVRQRKTEKAQRRKPQSA